MDVDIGAAAQEGRFVDSREGQAGHREREAGPDGSEAAKRHEIDDDRPVHADSCLMNVKAGHFSGRDARHGHRDIERMCDDAVVANRRGAGGPVGGRRIFLVGAERRGQPGGAESEVRADGRAVRRVVKRVSSAGAAVDRAADVDAVAEGNRVVAVSSIDVDDAGGRRQRLVTSHGGVEIECAVEPGIASGKAIVTEQPACLRDRQRVTGGIARHRGGRPGDRRRIRGLDGGGG